MSGQAHWLTLAVMFIGIVALAVLVLVGTRRGILLRAARRRVFCAKQQKEAHTIAIRRPEDGHWVNIERCDLLRDPDRVSCRKTCLEALNRGPHHALT